MQDSYLVIIGTFGNHSATKTFAGMASKVSIALLLFR
jgi:hypothetical protein